MKRILIACMLLLSVVSCTHKPGGRLEVTPTTRVDSVKVDSVEYNCVCVTDKWKYNKNGLYEVSDTVVSIIKMDNKNRADSIANSYDVPMTEVNGNVLQKWQKNCEIQ